MHQLGLVIPGMPLMPIGTNGKVAWSQTQLTEDVTDWYSERLKLDDAGAPAAVLFQGEWKPLTRVDERYVIADIPLFGSVGRTESWPRYVTQDGRLLADFEGRSVSATDPLNPGETRVSTASGFVVPADLDGDGVIYAISFDYGGFDPGSVLTAQDALGRANDVVEFRDATRGLVAYSQNFAVADGDGNILYTSYQAVPCRGYLARNTDGTWADGSDPSLLLDGTRYGGFHIPVKDGLVDAANPGFSGTTFTYGSGPVMRMVVSMKGGVVQGRNIIPGGQSGIPSLPDGEANPHFADQAALWLGNEAYPLRYVRAGRGGGSDRARGLRAVGADDQGEGDGGQQQDEESGDEDQGSAAPPGLHGWIELNRA